MIVSAAIQKMVEFYKGDLHDVTLNTYTHVKFDDAKDELLRVANA